MEQHLITDLKYLINKHIIQETKPKEKFLRHYTLRYSDGWLAERLHKLAEEQHHQTIRQDVKKLIHKYPAELFKNSLVLNEFEAILDHTLAILQHAHAPQLLNDQQQAAFVAQQINIDRAMYIVRFNRVQTALSPFQNQIIILYNLFRKMIYLSEHRVAWTYFGFDVLQTTILHPDHAHTLNFNTMLITPEQLNLKHKITFMGVYSIFQYVHQIITGFLANNKTNYFDTMRNVRQYFPNMSTLVENLNIHIDYKNQLVTQLSHALIKLHQYFKKEEILAAPELGILPEKTYLYT